MATYYVYKSGSGGDTGADWTNSFQTFGQAVTAATLDGDIIKVHYTHQEELTVDTTYTFTNNVAVLSVNKDSSDALTVMGTGGWVGNSTTNRGVVVVAGTGKWLYIWGMTWRLSGSAVDTLTFRPSASDAFVLTCEQNYLWVGISNAGSAINLGATAQTHAGILRMKDCTFRHAGATNQIVCCGTVWIEGGSLSTSGTAPTSGCFASGTGGGPCQLMVNGMDLSFVGSSNELVDYSAGSSSSFTFVNCKLASSFVVSETQTACFAEITLFNCSSGDQHYHLYHSNALGETTVSTGIYAGDAAARNQYDGTNRCSWKIVTTANCNFYAPYISPWFETYHSGTSAITPSIEVLADRTGSPLKDNEVWGEWSYQGTSGSTLASFVNDRCLPGGTPANQANSSLTASDWTGETAGSPTPWFGKFAPASAITPAEIGMLRARVCVGKASTTIYVDPTVRYS